MKSMVLSLLVLCYFPASLQGAKLTQKMMPTKQTVQEVANQTGSCEQGGSISPPIYHIDSALEVFRLTMNFSEGSDDYRGYAEGYFTKRLPQRFFEKVRFRTSPPQKSSNKHCSSDGKGKLVRKSMAFLTLGGCVDLHLCDGKKIHLTPGAFVVLKVPYDFEVVGCKANGLKVPWVVLELILTQLAESALHDFIPSNIIATKDKVSEAELGEGYAKDVAATFVRIKMRKVSMFENMRLNVNTKTENEYQAMIASKSVSAPPLDKKMGDIWFGTSAPNFRDDLCPLAGLQEVKRRYAMFTLQGCMEIKLCDSDTWPPRGKTFLVQPGDVVFPEVMHTWKVVACPGREEPEPWTRMYMDLTDNLVPAVLTPRPFDLTYDSKWPHIFFVLVLIAFSFTAFWFINRQRGTHGSDADLRQP